MFVILFDNAFTQFTVTSAQKPSRSQEVQVLSFFSISCKVDISRKCSYVWLLIYENRKMFNICCNLNCVKFLITKNIFLVKLFTQSQYRIHWATRCLHHIFNHTRFEFAIQCNFGDRNDWQSIKSAN